MYKRSKLTLCLLASLWLIFVLATSNTAGTHVGPMGSAMPQSAEKVIYVSRDVLGDENGSSWLNAFTDLQSALDIALDGDEIWVAVGVYTPTAQTSITDTRTATFALEPGVALYGGFSGVESARNQRDWVNNVTVLSGDLDGDDLTVNGIVTDTAGIIGDNAYRVVSAVAVTETAVLDGFTITAGHAEETPHANGGGMYSGTARPTLANLTFRGNAAAGSGGGLFSEAGHLSLTNIAFVSNKGRFGGGMASVLGNATLADVTFLGNHAEHGGGLYNTGSITMDVADFVGNWSTYGYGGGAYNNGGELRLVNGSFLNNRAVGGAGGLFNRLGSKAVLTNVEFRGNQGYGGGGIYNNGSELTLVNVLLSGNIATGPGVYYSGGGGLHTDSSAQLINVTFTGNRAADAGGGALIDGSTATAFINCILWGNDADMGAQMYVQPESGSLPVTSYSLVQDSGGSEDWNASLGTDGGHNIDSDPLFLSPVGASQAPTTTGNYRLQHSSPAVDVGNNLDVNFLTDLEGNPRVFNGIVDMGAYESVYVPAYVYLPLALRDYVRYFEGPWEVEPNDSYTQANGPLISGRDYYGYPNDWKDYFSLYMRQAGKIAVELTSHTGEGVQLQLWYGPPREDGSNRVAINRDAPYAITHTGPAGWYYVYIYTERGHNQSTPYTLRATYPEQGR